MTAQDHPCRPPVATAPEPVLLAGWGRTPPPSPLRLLHLACWSRPLPSTSPTVTPHPHPTPLKMHRVTTVAPLFAPLLFAHPLVVKHLFPPLLCLLSHQGRRGATTASESKPPPPKPPLLSELLLRVPWIRFAVRLTSSALRRCYRTTPHSHRPPRAATATERRHLFADRLLGWAFATLSLSDGLSVTTSCLSRRAWDSHTIVATSRTVSTASCARCAARVSRNGPPSQATRPCRPATVVDRFPGWARSHPWGLGPKAGPTLF
jgi:hypothetical protein